LIVLLGTLWCCVAGAMFPEKFSSLDQAFVSLFQLLTLDQWHLIYKDLMAVSERYPHPPPIKLSTGTHFPIKPTAD
jgi:hypothetical protein